MSGSLQPHGLYSLWNSPGQNTGVGSLSILQGIFPTQGSNPGFPHCGQILYQLSYKGSSPLMKIRRAKASIIDQTLNKNTIKQSHPMLAENLIHACVKVYAVCNPQAHEN